VRSTIGAGGSDGRAVDGGDAVVEGMPWDTGVNLMATYLADIDQPSDITWLLDNICRLLEAGLTSTWLPDSQAGFGCTVLVFRQKCTHEDAIGSPTCSLEVSMRLTNAMHLGCSLLLPVGTVNCIQTLKVNKRCWCFSGACVRPTMYRARVSTG
jgi:hypothetical protein